MRILCLTARLPIPPDRGDRLRAYHFLEHLAPQHELVLASFVASEAERAHLPALRRLCHEVHTVLLPPWRSAACAALNAWRQEPLQVLYYRSPAMRRLIARLTSEREFDAVYVHLFRMAQYAARPMPAYRIADLTDAISEEVARSLPHRGRASRLLYGLEGPRIARCEERVAEAFDEVWVISEADRRALEERRPAANFRVVPNGVDTERFRPTGQAARPNSLVFVGHLRVAHNVDAARRLALEVLPRARRQVAECTLDIVGADPAPQVRRLAAEPGVTVSGYVEDLNERLNRAAVFCAPLRFAAGVQNKVLEAMAAGLPVVTTGVVNAGLGARPGEEVLLGEEPEDLAEHVVRLWRDGALRARLGAAGRAFVAARYSWGAVCERVRSIADARRQQRGDW